MKVRLDAGWDQRVDTLLARVSCLLTSERRKDRAETSDMRGHTKKLGRNASAVSGSRLSKG